jgi:photosynthetic reaction center cytochrome c subunit
MRTAIRNLVAGGLLLAGLAAAPALSVPQSKPQTSPAPAPAATPAPASAATPAPAPAHAAGSFDQQRALAALQKEIAGKEDQPAEKVFMNIENFKGVPAGRLLRAMEAFTHALGVDCAYCHDPGHWESDDKEEKVAARGMMRMSGDINEKYLKGMPGLDAKARVSCTTCHRGQPKPEMDAPKGGH